MREWQRFRRSHPGRRFSERFHRAHIDGPHGRLFRFAYIGGGSVVFFIGLVMNALPFLPGGAAILSVGAAMVAKESKTAAEWLDRCELRLRHTWERVARGFKRK